MYVISGNHIGLAKLLQGYRLSADDGRHISTKTDGKKFVKLKPNETVLQVVGCAKYLLMHSVITVSNIEERQSYAMLAL